MGCVCVVFVLEGSWLWGVIDFRSKDAKSKSSSRHAGGPTMQGSQHCCTTNHSFGALPFSIVYRTSLSSSRYMSINDVGRGSNINF